MSDPFQDVGFGDGDEELQEDKREKFQPKKGETYRISFARWPVVEKDGEKSLDMDAPSPRFLRANVNFIEGAGYVINKGPAWTQIAGEDGRDRIGCILVSWPVHSDGKTDQLQFQAGRFKVLPYIFTPVKYKEFLRKNNTKPLGKSDLMLTCTNEDYQRLEISQYDNNYLREMMEKKPSLFRQLLEKILKIETRLKSLIGTNYSLQELRDKLELDDESPAVPEVAPDSEEAFDSLLDNLSIDVDG